MIKVIDNALSDKAYSDLLAQIACGPFVDEVNDIDGVTYPNICRRIPLSVSDEIDAIIGGSFSVEFLRRSPLGVHCPHPVHHDAVMGRISVMLYTAEIGGTAIMRHQRTGICSAPDEEEFVRIIADDADNEDAWEIIEIAHAKPNRMAVFDSRMMHSAQPFGGFGDGVNARTVYTRFVL